MDLSNHYVLSESQRIHKAKTERFKQLINSPNPKDKRECERLKIALQTSLETLQQTH